MLSANLVRFSFFFFALLLSASAFNASAQVDANADTVYVRLDCANTANCFTDIASLSSWMADVRMPNALSPLLVEVGVGTFSGPFQCKNLSHITLRGAGRINSVITGDESFIPRNTLFAPGMVLEACDHLSVSNLRVEGRYGAIWWKGNGETTWSDVDIEGAGRGWYERPLCDPALTKHSWFNSRIVSTPYVSANVTYTVSCGETWFHNTEISALAYEIDSRGWSWSDMRALWVVAGKARVIGGMLRTEASIPPQASSSSSALEVVRVNNAEAIITGAAIEADSSISHPLSVLVSENNGQLTVTGGSYSIRNPADLLYRVDPRGGSINAHYNWGTGTQPPGIISVTGADTFIETDCSAVGCQVPDADAHILTYDSMCATDGPWFDTITQRCRGL